MSCTLDNCDVTASLYGYRPSLAANAFFVAVLFLFRHPRFLHTTETTPHTHRPVVLGYNCIHISLLAARPL